MERNIIAALEALRGPKRSRKKPTEFMNLPTEIRLMIYKYLGPTKKRCIIPLKTRGHIVLINMSIAVGILATCRKINQEASSILTPMLKSLALQPPSILIQGHYLANIVRLPFIGSTHIYLLDEITAPNAALPTAIARYRKGQLSITHLRKLINAQKYIPAESHDAIKDLATFLLRTAHYDAQFQRSYPGRTSTLRITIEISDLDTIQKLRLKQWPLSRYFKTIFRPPPRHGRLVHADVFWVLQWFVAHAAMHYDRQKDWRFCVSWRYGDGREEVPQGAERLFGLAVLRGLSNRRLKDPDTVVNGGRGGDWDEDED